MLIKTSINVINKNSSHILAKSRYYTKKSNKTIKVNNVKNCQGSSLCNGY
jgi:hypothetical protein